MIMHLLKEASDRCCSDNVEMWCGKIDWEYSRYTHVFMIENWIDKPNGVKICKACWNALHERIGERND